MNYIKIGPAVSHEKIFEILCFEIVDWLTDAEMDDDDDGRQMITIAQLEPSPVLCNRVRQWFLYYITITPIVMKLNLNRRILWNKRTLASTCKRRYTTLFYWVNSWAVLKLAELYMPPSQWLITFNAFVHHERRKDSIYTHGVVMQKLLLLLQKINAF